MEITLEILREKYSEILLGESFLQIPKGRNPKKLHDKCLPSIFYNIFLNFLLGFIITLHSLALFRLAGKFSSLPLLIFDLELDFYIYVLRVKISSKTSLRMMTAAIFKTE